MEVKANEFIASMSGCILDGNCEDVREALRLSNIVDLPEAEKISYTARWVTAAVDSRRVDVLKLLLEDDRLKFDEQSMRETEINVIRSGNGDMMKTLLDDPRFESKNVAMKGILFHLCSFKVFEAVVAHEKTYRGLDTQQLMIVGTIRFGGSAQFMALLEGDRYNLSMCSNEFLLTVMYGSPHCVFRSLLRSPYIDPRKNNSFILEEAIKGCYLEHIHILLEDGRVDVSVCTPELIKAALRLTFAEHQDLLVELLAVSFQIDLDVIEACCQEDIVLKTLEKIRERRNAAGWCLKEMGFDKLEAFGNHFSSIGL